MRSLYDSTDFASDVMKSLAANAGQLDFPSFDSLMAFLVNVAKKKVIDEYRKVHNLKRNIKRNQPLYCDDEGAGPAGMIASGDPTASQVLRSLAKPTTDCSQGNPVPARPDRDERAGILSDRNRRQERLEPAQSPAFLQRFARVVWTSVS